MTYQPGEHKVPQQMSDIDVQETLRRIRDDLDALNDIVRGDGTYLNPGIMGVLEKTAAATEVNSQFISKVRWTIAGAATGGSLFGGAVVTILARVMGAE